MPERASWCGDDIGYEHDGYMERGEAWSSSGGEATYPDVRWPIGFMRRKPVVRVKAWMQPIVDGTGRR